MESPTFRPISATGVVASFCRSARILRSILSNAMSPSFENHFAANAALTRNVAQMSPAATTQSTQSCCASQCFARSPAASPPGVGGRRGRGPHPPLEPPSGSIPRRPARPGPWVRRPSRRAARKCQPRSRDWRDAPRPASPRYPPSATAQPAPTILAAEIAAVRGAVGQRPAIAVLAALRAGKATGPEPMSATTKSLSGHAAGPFNARSADAGLIQLRSIKAGQPHAQCAKAVKGVAIDYLGPPGERRAACGAATPRSIHPGGGSRRGSVRSRGGAKNGAFDPRRKVAFHSLLTTSPLGFSGKRSECVFSSHRVS